MIDTYNTETERYAQACEANKGGKAPEIEEVIDADPKLISWTRALKADAKRGKRYNFESVSLVEGMYRPFNKQWMYFNRRLNEMVYQVPKLFPTAEHENVVISCTGVADRKGFSVLATDQVPNMHLTDTGQCFPLYWYEKPDEKPKPQGDLFSGGDVPDTNGYIRREAITDWALSAFREHYRDETLGKEDIFWYVYGILHSSEYKQRFAADLKKMLPRIPFAGDFWVFSKAGRELDKWHLDYETVEPWPLIEEERHLNLDPAGFYRVTKMVFGKKNGQPDKTVIVYSGNLTLREIPREAYDYVVNGKSAIEWIMERYAVITDKASGITNDPNAWSDDPRYIVDLLKRIVRVSLETVKIVNSLPKLDNQP